MVVLDGYGNGVSTRKVDHVEQLRIDLMTEDRMSVLCRWAEELTGAICARTFARGSDGRCTSRATRSCTAAAISAISSPRHRARCSMPAHDPPADQSDAVSAYADRPAASRSTATGHPVRDPLAGHLLSPRSASTDRQARTPAGSYVASAPQKRCRVWLKSPLVKARTFVGRTANTSAVPAWCRKPS